MTEVVEVLWVSDAFSSAEHCVIQPEPGKAAIVGTAVLPLDGQPASIRYTVDTYLGWITRTVKIEIDAGEHSRGIELERVDDEWLVDGVRRPELDGCAHVDLGWSPATNTLPLRSNDLVVGERTVALSAWLRFPELDVVKSEQTYTRLTENTVRYESATFTAELETTPDDVVLVYGEDVWRAAAVQRAAARADRIVPPDAVVARTTASWTKATVPPALLGHHQTSRWAELIVERGSVRFVEADTGFEATATRAEVVVIVPNRDHHIEPDDDALFCVRFYEQPYSGT